MFRMALILIFQFFISSINELDEYRFAGSYEIEFDANGLTSGVYFYQLKNDSCVETKKMIILR